MSLPRQTIKGAPEEVRSWEYGHWPKVAAAVPLTDGGSVLVYGEASRWGHGHIAVSWVDGELNTCWAWISAANVRRLTPSEADIIEYHQCPPDGRSIRWAERLPVFCLTEVVVRPPTLCGPPSAAVDPLGAVTAPVFGAYGFDVNFT